MSAYDAERDRTRARAAFQSLLVKTKPAVEAKMTAMFAARRVRRGKHGKEVAHVVDVARDISMRGGKRFRAALLMASYLGSATKGAFKVGLSGGVALEMLQSYLLMQDERMDGDVERRGGPSAHVALLTRLGKGPLEPERAGAVGALLASDFVWGLAVDALLDAKVDARLVVKAMKELVQIHEDVVAGQVLDTVARKADVEVLHDLKTGSYTVRGPLALGAILADAPATTLRALAKYADPLGVAFQLRDDLLGVFGTIEEAGRPRGSDLLSGKKTSVMRHALPRLRGADKRAFSGAWLKRGASASAVAAAVAAVESSGAREAVEKRLAELCSRAELHASRLPLSARARDELAGAALAIRVGPGGREAR